MRCRHCKIAITMRHEDLAKLELLLRVDLFGKRYSVTNLAGGKAEKRDAAIVVNMRRESGAHYSLRLRLADAGAVFFGEHTGTDSFLPFKFVGLNGKHHEVVEDPDEPGIVMAPVDLGSVELMHGALQEITAYKRALDAVKKLLLQ